MLNRLYIVIGMLMILVLTGAFVVPRFIDWSSRRVQMEALASEALGTPVKIAGDIDFVLLPQPRLRFVDVLVGDGDVPVAQAEAVEAEFSLMDFLRDQFVVTRLVLKAPRLNLTIAEDGTFVSLLHLPETIEAGNVSIAHAEIQAGNLHLTDSRSGDQWSVYDVDGILQLSALRGPFNFAGMGTFDEEIYRFRVSTSEMNPESAMQIATFVGPESGAFSVSAEGLLQTALAPSFAGKAVFRQRAHTSDNAGAIRGDVVVTAEVSLSSDRLLLSDYTWLPDENRASTRLTGAAVIDLGGKPRFDAVISGGVVALAPRDAREERVGQAYELVRLLNELPSPSIPPIPGTVSVVYFAAALSKSLFKFFSLPLSARRIMLACGVSAAIAASFNAPIAGVLFAHEVILGHFAMSAFVPLVFAAMVASIMSRSWFGEAPAFLVPDYSITSYWEIPAFALLGITCAVVAILFQSSLIGSDWVSRHMRMPAFMRPILGGLLIGLIALVFPQVLGVGYEATDAALANSLELKLMLALIVAKTLATAITMGSRMGGGIFSPALYLGAMTGGAFGIMAASVFPEMASSEGLYAIIGMGAVAAAVLGAPISTAVMIFELTGGFAFSVALLFAVSISTGLTQLAMGRSFFYWQLYTRGIMLEEGPHQYLARRTRVRDLITPFPPGEEITEINLAKMPAWLRPDDTLEAALRAFDATGHASLIVVEHGDHKPIGLVHHVDALANFNKALVAQSREEHL